MTETQINLETAQQLSEMLKDSPLPSEAKTVGVMGAALGANPASIINGMMGITNRMETLKAEQNNPKPKQPNNYTETEAAIAAMLQENTGTDMLDSGGAYGRAWQRNRAISDFRKTPSCNVEIDQWTHDGKTETTITLSYSIFHYLTNFLALTKTAKQLQKRYDKYVKAHPDNYEIQNMEDFATEISTRDVQIINTYNYETLLGGTLQYASFTYQDTEYILLQIHGGCDVRGGYTDAKVFEINDSDYFFLAQSDAAASCECGYCNAYSDDSGYNWYPDIDTSQRYKDVSNPEKTTSTPNVNFTDRFTFQDDKTLICKKCSKPLTFSVMEDC